MEQTYMGFYRQKKITKIFNINFKNKRLSKQGHGNRGTGNTDAWYTQKSHSCEDTVQNNAAPPNSTRR